MAKILKNLSIVQCLYNSIRIGNMAKVLIVKKCNYL